MKFNIFLQGTTYLGLEVSKKGREEGDGRLVYYSWSSLSLDTDSWIKDNTSWRQTLRVELSGKE